MPMSTENLKHVVRRTSNDAMILVLNTGAIINPEAEAMLQALHSRSAGGIARHLEVLKREGSERFMSLFYVGYGHKSIGDCGTCTIFIEGVSMLAAKAIQDWPLYSGQEASTRFIDFAKQSFFDPTDTPEGTAVLNRWRLFYLRGTSVLQDFLTERFPRQAGENEITYEKAIRARSFDVMRGFLPAGAATNLAWHTNLRQAVDHLMLLRHHPLHEVRDVANAIEDALKEAFPSSFGQKRHAEMEEYNAMLLSEHMYFTRNKWLCKEFEVERDGVDRRQLGQYEHLLRRRPPKTELPRIVGECGTLQFGFWLDFGSFRDVQRHRPVIQQMPLVVTDIGFEPWYLDELPSALKTEAQNLIEEQDRAIAQLKRDGNFLSPFERQYYIAMGYQIPNRISGTIPEFTYLVELRATRFVHPTLRKRAREMATAMLKLYGDYGLVLHLDDDHDRFDVRRGEHDIVQR
ncbi:MAG: hypothetical protein COZ49_00340 [Candidatus Yonathbacteria bacterium CG_4_10_14_3_um_filter_47_65]|uniref:Thymidylate synthase n=2 Tax=Parcubacteria group TaxID=1794811 RepID=A0A2M8D7L7_9BACT|nr:MAG: hypothetical protein COX54_00525 [Candidatus Yonathbacteria bacterium CG23_combo_of_CG06-09_8_20_14_all_46_18]PIQ31833.1 MAG: hypothetical protein COW61_03020 [Candidatus Yonathbacteria bacterium CG17_big_fil_post_rev_8_21_14_2_50_46_19]PIX56778.1 MAG: hypothetical protein COZ49_00340 [Candidatus Yonathbacteria bacterium CG_4_10_14_3_um_filter_47_65]PIY57612.1 MAG: hypothetical protein COY99_02335 [Candidatus Yonathbacteria bacterium CG_4_10_14_0_8_um_filter_47_645]PJB83117.1 MAG: hypot